MAENNARRMYRMQLQKNFSPYVARQILDQEKRNKIIDIREEPRLLKNLDQELFELQLNG